ncbi:MAG: hypothetical protein HGA47_08220 [Zoogloea sp.]|nr:hypothetical protein [Zoogloea sp.]
MKSKLWAVLLALASVSLGGCIVAPPGGPYSDEHHHRGEGHGDWDRGDHDHDHDRDRRDWR